MSKADDAHMHRALYDGLRRLARGEDIGSAVTRDLLLHRGLIEWVPGEGRPRLTHAGAMALERERRDERGAR